MKEGNYEQKYTEAVKIANCEKPPSGCLSTDLKIAMYSHYKQAEVGPVNTPRPGFFDPVGRTKWDSWNNLGDMSQEDARKKYIQIVKEIYGRDF